TPETGNHQPLMRAGANGSVKYRTLKGRREHRQIVRRRRAGTGVYTSVHEDAEHRRRASCQAQQAIQGYANGLTPIRRTCNRNAKIAHAATPITTASTSPLAVPAGYTVPVARSRRRDTAKSATAQTRNAPNSTTSCR